MVLTDKFLFEEALNYDFPGFEEIREYAMAGDYKTSRRLLAKAVRENLNPEAFFSTYTTNITKETAIDRAEKACRHYMISVEIPMDFGDKPVDWYANPTYNGYKEWTWQLSRHWEIQFLAMAYRHTGDKRYIAASEELLNSWLTQADAPPSGTNPYETKCWRTIECGIRMGWSWPSIINTFIPLWSDDTICEVCKSVYEHGERLHTMCTDANWLIMEMNGLCHVGVLFPFFKKSQEWYEFAMNRLEREIKSQVYPDKAHYELSQNYQVVIITNSLYAINVARAFKREIPEELLKILEGCVEYYIHVMRPDRVAISTNDGNESARYYVPTMLKSLGYYEPFKENPYIKWLYGEEDGAEPPKDYVFEYAGNAALRSDWSEKAVMLYFDGGVFGKAHQHEDKLSIILYADGKELLVDPGNYAYDTSLMRKYTIETDSHNTVMVDGLGQSRRSGYVWKSEAISVKSDLKYKLSSDVDALRAHYDEGYGADKKQLARHERSVYFVKKLSNLRPFVIVSDRFQSLDGNEHCYDVMWHIDAETISARGLGVRADTLRIETDSSDIERVGLEIDYGKKYPSLQGWCPNSMKQKDYRPIYTAIHKVSATDARHVTVLYPDGGDKIGISSIKAGCDVKETEIRIYTDDGREFVFDEKDYTL